MSWNSSMDRNPSEVNTFITGRSAENRAAAFLKSVNYSILERDYHYGHIDIDIIAYDPEGILVFIEVKYRRAGSCQNPSEAVSKPKQRNICMAAIDYITRHSWSYSRPCRFDVIAISGQEIHHIKDAFSLCCPDFLF